MQTGLVSGGRRKVRNVQAFSSTPGQKRKLHSTNFEIPDSDEDDDYGWKEGDEDEFPPQPSQWQGSEDILLRPPSVSDEEGEPDANEEDGESAFEDTEEQVGGLESEE